MQLTAKLLEKFANPDVWKYRFNKNIALASLT